MNPPYSLRLKSPSPRYSHTLPLRTLLSESVMRYCPNLPVCKHYHPNPTVRIRDTLLSKSTRPQTRYRPNPTHRPQADPTEILRLSSLSLSPRISFSSAATADVAAALPSVSQSISPSVRKSVCQSVRPFERQPSVCSSVNRPSVNRPAVRQPSICPPVNRFSSVRPSTVRPSTGRPSVRQPSDHPSVKRFFSQKIKIKFQQIIGVAVQV